MNTPEKINQHSFGPNSEIDIWDDEIVHKCEKCGKWFDIYELIKRNECPIV